MTNNPEADGIPLALLKSEELGALLRHYVSKPAYNWDIDRILAIATELKRQTG